MATNGEACENCAALADQVEELADQVEDLERLIDQVRQFCQEVIDRAEPTLSQAGGVPRGQWSRLKGRVDVAGRIIGALG